jgi:hypothetical protein
MAEKPARGRGGGKWGPIEFRGDQSDQRVGSGCRPRSSRRGSQRIGPRPMRCTSHPPWGKEVRCRWGLISGLSASWVDAIHLPGKEAVRQPRVVTIDRTSSGSSTGPMAPTLAAPVEPDEPELIRRIGRGAVRPLYVFSPENRLAYMDSAWPWGLVGKVFNSNGKVGSGALIGNRLAATAGHMVPWGSGPCG